MEGHVGLLNRHEHLGGPPEVDGPGDVGVVLGEIEGHRRCGIEIGEARCVREQPLGHDGHALAVATGHCLVHLGRPLLGRWEQNTAGVGDLRADGFLTEERDEGGGVDRADSRPVGETESVHRRVESVVDAILRINPGAVWKQIAGAIGCGLAVAAWQGDRRGCTARSAGGEQQDSSDRRAGGPAAKLRSSDHVVLRSWGGGPLSGQSTQPDRPHFAAPCSAAPPCFHGHLRNFRSPCAPDVLPVSSGISLNLHFNLEGYP
ncbi:unannotated protein [freshwater metagenome]|uniref:Unannotated protein n=1 Tax=freshwater metagenome TaxID=449393 RepID=A0A6J7INE9_9ZZZZ